MRKTVVGDPANGINTPRRVDLRSDLEDKTDHGLRVRIEPESGAFVAGKPALINFTLADAAGEPISDLEPYFGAWGHMFIVSRIPAAHGSCSGNGSPAPGRIGCGLSSSVVGLTPVPIPYGSDTRTLAHEFALRLIATSPEPSTSWRYALDPARRLCRIDSFADRPQKMPWAT
jgi:hypothetical protein